jgi:hypothetical protein
VRRNNCELRLALCAAAAANMLDIVRRNSDRPATRPFLDAFFAFQSREEHTS